MLKVYANDALLHGDWLLGQEDGAATSDGGGSGLPSMEDISSGISKVGGIIKQGQAALNTVTGGGTKPAGAKPDTSDPYYRCNTMRDARSKAQCKYEVDRALALRAKATAPKKTSTSNLALLAVGAAVVGGVAWWILK